MRTAIAQEPAYLLHSFAYGETSEIGDFFTRHHGRVGVLMRARRGSTKSPKLLQGRRYTISLVGKGELLQLKSAERSLDACVDIAGPQLLSVLYVCELLHALLQRNDPHEALFDDFARWQSELRTDQHGLALRRFEHRLLDALGYGIDVRHDHDGYAVQAEHCYRVDANQGLLRTVSTDANAVSGTAFLHLSGAAEPQTEVFSQAMAQQLRALMRYLLEHRLGDKTIRSWQLAASMQQLKARLR
jgi:DNA repair protein RecO (recombination protein O)